MYNKISAAVLAVSVLSLTGCDSSDLASNDPLIEPSGRMIEVSGRVSSASSGKPIKRAIVTLVIDGAAWTTVLANDQGDFSISKRMIWDCTGSVADLDVSATGFHSLSYGSTSSPSVSGCSAGQQHADISLSPVDTQDDVASPDQ